MYEDVMLMRLLYGAETWTFYANQVRKLNNFYLSCLCRILSRTRKSWAEPGYSASRPYSGHTVALEWPPGTDGRPTTTQVTLLGDVAVDARRTGGQIKRNKNNLEDSLKRPQINTATWEELAQDRSVVKTGAAV
ncbi:unnamed protein product [Dibothriocephalus latus]|uniref:Uncharacterized protein n=1 Tax=Dibothriocephalus latus TaxID=60516 RepID=A0A3P7NYT1_DIBLA|nr:unnamed protein product [Dibothriocephalus latus]